MKAPRLFFTVLVGILLSTDESRAYHFLYELSGTTPVPIHWQTTANVFKADTDGPAGQDFTTLATAAVTTWNNVSDALDIFGTPVTSTVNFTGANINAVWGKLTGDGQYELVYDADGSALMALGIDPASINGVGRYHTHDAAGQRVIDDAYFVVTGTRSDFDLLSTMVHELGHVQGLAHSTVGMHNSATPDAALDKISLSSVPTMHPFSFGTGSNRRTLEPDDMAALRELYPATGAASRWASISGKVRRCGSLAAVTGACVRAVSLTNSAIQISRFTSFDGNSDGRYAINYIPAGTYRIIVEPFGANGFTLNRFGNPPNTAEDDFDFEYLSPTKQENNCTEEIPEGSSDIATLTANAGTTVLADDIHVGSPRLAFVVDDTGSMGEEIASVRAVLNATINALEIGSIFTPFPLTAVVTFKDDVTKRIVSDDPQQLRTAVNALFASGGDDCPEASNAALLVAGRILRRNSVAILFTDADSRPDGPARSTVTDDYRAKGLRLFTLLSGTCTGEITPSREPFGFRLEGSDGSQRVPTLTLKGSSNSEEFPPPPVNGAEPAVVTFSNISNSTGGFFVAIEGINSGNQDEITRYENTGTNLAISAVLPAIALATPTSAPRGTTLNIEINASNTNFINGQSVLSFSGTGITVNSLSVVSPTHLIANVSIAPGADLGFRDAKVLTNLGPGSTEEAKGIGILNIVETPTVPSTISVTPAQGGQGQTLDVVINAAAVTFTTASSADFGTGITVLTNEMINDTTLRAHISINSDATIGYRRVSVLTPGSGAAVDNSPAGAFQVVIATPAIPIITSVSPNNAARSATLNISVTGANTHFNSKTVLSFGSAGITVNTVTVNSATNVTANITVAPDAPLGFRDVFATTEGETAVILDGFQVVESPSTCEICHKRTLTLTLPCGSLEYRRHLDHGDTPGPCAK